MQNINLCLIWITYCLMRAKELCVDSINQIMIIFSYKFLYNPLSIFSIEAYTKCSFTSNSSQRSWLTLSLVILNKLCRSMSFFETHPLSRYYISILVSFQISFSNTKFGYFGKHVVKCFSLIYAIELQFVDFFNWNTLQHLLFQTISIQLVSATSICIVIDNILMFHFKLLLDCFLHHQLQHLHFINHVKNRWNNTLTNNRSTFV